jgi:hypothetical protein
MSKKFTLPAIALAAAAIAVMVSTAGAQTAGYGSSTSPRMRITSQGNWFDDTYAPRGYCVVHTLSPKGPNTAISVDVRTCTPIRRPEDARPGDWIVYNENCVRGHWKASWTPEIVENYVPYHCQWQAGVRNGQPVTVLQMGE